MKMMQLDHNNFRAASEFIEEQMTTQSWWPREKPHLANEQFQRMKETPESLTVWCDKWLYSGQKRQLERYLQRTIVGTPIPKS